MYRIHSYHYEKPKRINKISREARFDRFATMSLYDMLPGMGQGQKLPRCIIHTNRSSHTTSTKICKWPSPTKAHIMITRSRPWTNIVNKGKKMLPHTHQMYLDTYNVSGFVTGKHHLQEFDNCKSQSEQTLSLCASLPGSVCVMNYIIG